MSETKSESMMMLLCQIRTYLLEDVTTRLKVIENRQISFNEWFHREWVALKKQKPETDDQSEDLLSFSIKIEAMQNQFAEVVDRINKLEKANINRIDDYNSLNHEISTIRGAIHVIQERICSLEQKQNRGFFARLFNLGS